MCATSTTESVAVVILNHNGRRHLAPCLRAALAMRGLAGPEAVFVADNGSSDGSRELVRDMFPRVRTLSFAANLGFAAGNNRAAREVPDAYSHLLFINNDTAADQAALTKLWTEIERGAVCAGARLVSWDGGRIDFDGGGAALTGHGHPLGHGRPLPRKAAGPTPTLFCSGAAMLVHRDTYLALGGFDADYFAYYEDLDFGWRLWLAGHVAHHVPAAVVRHVGGASAAAMTRGDRALRHERNALATVFKNLDDGNLRRVLPAALALAAHRAGAVPDVIDSAGAPEGAWPPVPPESWAGWSALAPLELDFGRLQAGRERVQSLRRRPDARPISLMGAPYAPVPATRVAWEALRAAVARHGLEDVFGPMPSLPRGGLAGAWLAARALDVLRERGPGGLAREARDYVRWRRMRP